MNEFLMSMITVVLLVWIPALYLIGSIFVKIVRFMIWWLHGSCAKNDVTNLHVMQWSRNERTKMLHHCELCGMCTWDTSIDRDIEVFPNNE
jgi:hypothetical protein